MAIRALIVDDESAGRLAVRSLCETCPDIDVIGECASGREAIDAIRRERPDVAFLDIKMRPISGLEVAASLAADETPAIVFVTAYDRYAIRAFELNALDYLLKPLEPDRFDQMLARVRERVGNSPGINVRAWMSTAIQAAMRDLMETGIQPRARRLLVETAGRAQFLSVDDIESIVAQRNYAVLQVAGASHVVRSTLDAMQSRLPEPPFVRIHRSVIINTNFVRAMEKAFHGEYLIEMKGGATFTSGRHHRRRLQEFLLRTRASDDH